MSRSVDPLIVFIKHRIIPLLLITLFLLFAILGYKGSNKKFIGPPFGTMLGQDFRAVLRASREIRDGNNPYVYAIELGKSMDFINFMNWEEAPYVYPPILAIIMTPLLILGVNQALSAWMVFNLILLISIAFLAAKAFISNKSSLIIWMILYLVIFFFFGPTQLEMKLGQVDILILFLLMLTYFLYTKNNDFAAIPLALAISIKPFVVIMVIFFLWKRCYRMVLISFVSVAVLLFIGFLRVGVSSISSYFEVNRLWASGELLAYPVNQSINGFFQRVFTSNSYIQPLADLPWLAKSLPIILGGLALLVWFLVVDRETKPGGDKIGFGLTVVTMMLISPLAEDIHFVWVLIPIAALLSMIDEGDQTPRSILYLIPAIAICVYLGLPDLNDAIYHGWEVLRNPNSLVEKGNLIFTGAYLFGLIGLEIYMLIYQKIKYRMIT